MDSFTNLTMEQMKNSISKAGNLFYQYRACRRDAHTIYDIENIRHGVVYARTPLHMNDPFDSMIGFSTDDIYEECIDLVLNQASINADENTLALLKTLMKHRLLGNTVEFISALNNLKKYIYVQCAIARVPLANLPHFVVNQHDKLYKNCPSETKKHFSKQSFLLFALFIKDYKDVTFTEDTLLDALKLEGLLDELESKVSEFRDNVYIPFIKDFISKITVTCFSASGWDNQLMWAHYANSYAGICVEYDFAKMNDFIGFISPVKYSSQRPTITLKDLGLNELQLDEAGKPITSDPDTGKILSYLLAKNDCWKYEKEWRIINIGGNPYSPIFIKVPFIKSITLGLNIDEVCKQFLCDVCFENGIDCYQLAINPSDYVLSRQLLTADAYIFDSQKELKYCELLAKHAIVLGKEIDSNAETALDSIKNGAIAIDATISMLSLTLDYLSDTYFLKLSYNRYRKHSNGGNADHSEHPSITTAISQINNFIDTVKLAAESFNDSLLNLALSQKISLNDFRAANKTISDILEMVKKHASLNWFGEAPET